MHFLVKLNRHFSFENRGGQIGDPAAEEVGYQANQQVAHRQRAKRQAQRGEAVGDTEIDKQLAGVDVRKQPVHRMTAIGGRRVVARFVFLRHKAAKA